MKVSANKIMDQDCFSVHELFIPRYNNNFLYIKHSWEGQRMHRNNLINI